MMRRALFILPLLTLLLAGCALCGQLDPRRKAPEAAAAPDGAAAAGEPTAEPTPNAADIAAGLEAESWQRRMAAAHAPVGRDDIPIEERVVMLADALRREIADPSTEPPPDGSYLSVEGMMRLRLVRSLGAQGEDAIPVLRQHAQDASGATRDSYLIALGYLGDASVAPDLREALRSSPDPVIRMDAARALGALGDREAIPVLKDALADPYVAEAESSLGAYHVYPVREQAAGALVALGVSVERRGATFTVRP